MSNWPPLPPLGNINTYLVSFPLLSILASIKEAILRILLRPAPLAPEQTSPFLSLPFEMRQAIYKAAILDDSEGGSNSDECGKIADSINLLQTCRQVKAEAEPIRYQRPQSFMSQAKLFHWLDRSREAHLERVRTLTLHLTDVDLSTLLDPMMASPQKFPTAWSVYQYELRRLEDALRSLPNLSSLTVIPTKDNRSMLLRQFYRLFLQIISTRSPKLLRLEVHDTKDILIQAPALNDIREVIFTESHHDDAEAEPGETATSPRTIKVESDAAEGRLIHSPLSPRTMRHKRVTRVVSD